MLGLLDLATRSRDRGSHHSGHPSRVERPDPSSSFRERNRWTGVQNPRARKYGKRSSPMLEHYVGIGLETKTPALAMLTIPLVDGEVCHGVMQALNPTGREHFDSFDEEVFLAFGSLIATTLTRMQVQEQAKQKEIDDAYRQAELSIARQAQFSFMPAPSFESGSLKIRVFQEQAADVGGDFYAYHEMGDQCLLVAVGDASGKGIPAALESARVCTLISLTAPSCSPERLSEWLAGLNNVLQATSEKARKLDHSGRLADRWQTSHRFGLQLWAISSSVPLADK